MKRLGLAIPAAVAYVIAAALPALAEYPPTKPPTEVKGAGGGGVAFTGADISLGVVLLAVLVVVGVTALLISRRRATATR